MNRPRSPVRSKLFPNANNINSSLYLAENKIMETTVFYFSYRKAGKITSSWSWTKTLVFLSAKFRKIIIFNIL